MGQRHGSHPWFLSAEEGAWLGAGRSWTEGNRVEPLIHGRTYFARLVEVLETLAPGDQVFLTDWRGDDNEKLTDEGPDLMGLLTRLARRGYRCGACSGARIQPGWASTKRKRPNLPTSSILRAASSCWTSGSDAPALITRSWSSCTAPTSRTRIWPLSAGSTCVTAGATATSISAIRRHSTWIDATASGRLGTTCRQRSTAPRWRNSSRPSESAGTTGRRSSIGALLSGRIRVHVTHEPTVPEPLLAIPEPRRRGTQAVQVLRTYPARRPRYPFAPRGSAPSLASIRRRSGARDRCSTSRTSTSGLVRLERRSRRPSAEAPSSA